MLLDRMYSSHLYKCKKPRSDTECLRASMSPTISNTTGNHSRAPIFSGDCERSCLATQDVHYNESESGNFRLQSTIILVPHGIALRMSRALSSNCLVRQWLCVDDVGGCVIQQVERCLFSWKKRCTSPVHYSCRSCSPFEGVSFVTSIQYLRGVRKDQG